MQIEKGIPLPPADRGGRIKPNFRDGMQVGDSYMVTHNQSREAALAVGYAKVRKLGWKFTTRKVEGGVRVWRTA